MAALDSATEDFLEWAKDFNFFDEDVPMADIDEALPEIPLLDSTALASYALSEFGSLGREPNVAVEDWLEGTDDIAFSTEAPPPSPGLPGTPINLASAGSSALGGLLSGSARMIRSVRGCSRQRPVSFQAQSVISDRHYIHSTSIDHGLLSRMSPTSSVTSANRGEIYHEVERPFPKTQQSSSKPNDDKRQRSNERRPRKLAREHAEEFGRSGNLSPSFSSSPIALAQQECFKSPAYDAAYESDSSWRTSDDAETWYKQIQDELSNFRSNTDRTYFVTQPLQSRQRRIVHSMCHLLQFAHVTVEKDEYQHEYKQIVVSKRMFALMEGGTLPRCYRNPLNSPWSRLNSDPTVLLFSSRTELRPISRGREWHSKERGIVDAVAMRRDTWAVRFAKPNYVLQLLAGIARGLPYPMDCTSCDLLSFDPIVQQSPSTQLPLDELVLKATASLTHTEERQCSRKFDNVAVAPLSKHLNLAATQAFRLRCIMSADDILQDIEEECIRIEEYIRAHENDQPLVAYVHLKEMVRHVDERLTSLRALLLHPLRNASYEAAALRERLGGCLIVISEKFGKLVSGSMAAQPSEGRDHQYDGSKSVNGARYESARRTSSSVGRYGCSSGYTSTDSDFSSCYSNLSGRFSIGTNHTGNVSEAKKRRHRSPSPESFSCAYCMKTFARQCDLTKHEKIHDQSNYSHICEYCEKGFLWKKDLKRHIKSVHKPILHSTSSADEIPFIFAEDNI